MVENVLLPEKILWEGISCFPCFCDSYNGKIGNWKQKSHAVLDHLMFLYSRLINSFAQFVKWSLSILMDFRERRIAKADRDKKAHTFQNYWSS